jgi:hypothetical protein
VPKTLRFETPNPAIDFVGGRLRVVDRLTSLDNDGQPLVIGVNSFGFNGTNAHIVLREAPTAATGAGAHAMPAASETALLSLILSTRSAAALPQTAARYLPSLDNGTAWNTLTANAAHRRQWLKHRAIVAPSTLPEARAALGVLVAPATDHTGPALVQGDTSGDDTRLVLVFSGNGSSGQIWASSCSYRRHRAAVACDDQVAAVLAVHDGRLTRFDDPHVALMLLLFFGVRRAVRMLLRGLVLENELPAPKSSQSLIAHCATRETMRGTRVFSALFTNALHAGSMDGDGGRQIVLDVLVSNTRAYDLYRRLGFVELPRRGPVSPRLPRELESVRMGFVGRG